MPRHRIPENIVPEAYQELLAKVKAAIAGGKDAQAAIWNGVCEETTDDMARLAELFEAAPDRELTFIDQPGAAAAVMQDTVMANLAVMLGRGDLAI